MEKTSSQSTSPLIDHRGRLHDHFKAFLIKKQIEPPDRNSDSAIPSKVPVKTSDEDDGLLPGLRVPIKTETPECGSTPAYDTVPIKTEKPDSGSDNYQEIFAAEDIGAVTSIKTEKSICDDEPNGDGHASIGKARIPFNAVPIKTEDTNLSDEPSCQRPVDLVDNHREESNNVQVKTEKLEGNLVHVNIISAPGTDCCVSKSDLNHTKIKTEPSTDTSVSNSESERVPMSAADCAVKTKKPDISSSQHMSCGLKEESMDSDDCSSTKSFHGFDDSYEDNGFAKEKNRTLDDVARLKKSSDSLPKEPSVPHEDDTHLQDQNLPPIVDSNGTNVRTRTERKAKKAAKLLLKEVEEYFERENPRVKMKFGELSTGKKGLELRQPKNYQRLKDEFNRYKGDFPLQECYVKVQALTEKALVSYGVHLDGVEEKVDIWTLKKGLFSCPHCSFRTNHVIQLRRHSWKHKTQTGYHQCFECDYRSKWYQGVKIHVSSVHRREKRYECPHCDYKAATSAGLKQHVRLHTGDRPYKCSYCNYTAATTASLRTHTFTHTGEKPYACPHCSYRCTQYPHLKSHLYVHTNEKPYACKLCDFKTRQSSHLRCHMRLVHSDIKPFKCELCSFRCKGSNTLKYHMRRHTGEKPYACALCPYRTTQSSPLKLHLLCHQEKRKYTCSLCSYSSHKVSVLNYHTGTCHNIKGE